jgi:hypothetical protein
MELLNRLRKSAPAFILAVLFPVSAAAVSFDSSARSLSLSDLVGGMEYAPVSAPAAILAQQPAAARVYDFKTLYKSLGYPSPGYFGSNERTIQDIESYISKEDTFYQEINGYLRFYPASYDWSGTGPEDAKLIVKNIDGIFRKAPALPADLVLFRGLSLKYRDNKPYTAGEEFTDKGYASTSTSFKVANYFATGMHDDSAGERKAVLVLYFDRQEKGILIDQNEDEVILGHGTKFRVMGTRDANGYDLYLTQVCAGDCETVLRDDVRNFWRNFSVR